MPDLLKVDMEFVGSGVNDIHLFTEVEYDRFVNSNTFSLYTINSVVSEAHTIPPPPPVIPGLNCQYFKQGEYSGGVLIVTNFELPDSVDHGTFRCAFKVHQSGMEYIFADPMTSFEHYKINKTGGLNQVELFNTNLRGDFWVMWDTRIEIEY